MRGSSLSRRVRAIEAQQGRGSHRRLWEMSDADLYRVLNERDPVTGEVRTNLSLEELTAIAYEGATAP